MCETAVWTHFSHWGLPGCSLHDGYPGLEEREQREGGKGRGERGERGEGRGELACRLISSLACVQSLDPGIFPGNIPHFLIGYT